MVRECLGVAGVGEVRRALDARLLAVARRVAVDGAYGGCERGLAERFTRRVAPFVGEAEAVGCSEACGLWGFAEGVEAAGCAVDGLAPGEDAVGGVGGVGGLGDGVAARAVAVFSCDGVGAAKHFLGRDVVEAEAGLVSAVLAEDFDAAIEVGGNDDIAVGVGTAGQVGGRFFWFGYFAEVRRHGGVGKAGMLGAVICRRSRRVVRLSSAHQSDWRRVAEIVERVARYAEEFSRFDRGHYSCGDNGRVCLKHLNGPFVLVSFGLLTGRPYEDFAVFTTANDEFCIITE